MVSKVLALRGRPKTYRAGSQRRSFLRSLRCTSHQNWFHQQIRKVSRTFSSSVPGNVGGFPGSREGWYQVLYQAFLTDFIREGHFARHIRRMRVLYMDRRRALVNAIQIQMRDMLGLLTRFLPIVGAGVNCSGTRPAPDAVVELRAIRDAPSASGTRLIGVAARKVCRRHSATGSPEACCGRENQLGRANRRKDCHR